MFAFLIVCVIICVSLGFYFSRSDKIETDVKKENIKDSLISQYQLKERYRWEDIVLWQESKQDFEKAYNTKLYSAGYTMDFAKDPSCIDPLGGQEEWSKIKICYSYRFDSDHPGLLNALDFQTPGMILVVIGNTYNFQQNFMGRVYFYAPQK